MNARQTSFVVQRATLGSWVGLSLCGVALLVLLSLPWWGGLAWMRLVVEFACYLSLAQLWNLLAGYAGMVSVGQQLFVGLGGYLLFFLSGRLGVSPLLAVLLCGVLSALLAVPSALLLFRLRGAYFAIGSWVLAEAVRLGIAQVGALGGGSGQSLPASVLRQVSAERDTRELLIYLVGVTLAVALTVAMYLLLRSRHGLALTAIRDSEAAANSLGVNIARTRLWVYVVAAAGTGMIGALLFLQKLRISPSAAFSVQDWTAVVIFIVIIGGLGTLEGPLIGTLVYFLLRGALAQFGPLYMIILGSVAVLMMLKAPQGLWGTAGQRWGWQVFPLRRRLVWGH